MEPGEQRQMRKIAKCLPHPNFRVFNYAENDIAIIIVAEPFQETETFAPTKLKRMAAEPIDHEECRIGKSQIEKVFLKRKIMWSFAFR